MPHSSLGGKSALHEALSYFHCAAYPLSSANKVSRRRENRNLKRQPGKETGEDPKPLGFPGGWNGMASVTHAGRGAILSGCQTDIEKLAGTVREGFRKEGSRAGASGRAGEGFWPLYFVC